MPDERYLRANGPGEFPLPRTFLREHLAIAAWVAIMLIGFPTLAITQILSKPAEVVTATDCLYPANSIADGVVVLDVSLSVSSQVAEVATVRGTASLTSAATSAVQSWGFRTASREWFAQTISNDDCLSLSPSGDNVGASRLHACTSKSSGKYKRICSCGDCLGGICGISGQQRRDRRSCCAGKCG